jgi:hypothetical protein
MPLHKDFHSKDLELPIEKLRGFFIIGLSITVVSIGFTVKKPLRATKPSQSSPSVFKR